MAGDDVVRVVVGQQHALDLAADEPGPEHRRCADASEAECLPVQGHGQFEVGVQARTPSVEGVAHADDPFLQRVDVGHCARVHAYAEERQIDHTQRRNAVFEQSEHHPAQR